MDFKILEGKYGLEPIRHIPARTEHGIECGTNFLIKRNGGEKSALIYQAGGCSVGFVESYLPEVLTQI